MILKNIIENFELIEKVKNRAFYYLYKDKKYIVGEEYVFGKVENPFYAYFEQIDFDDLITDSKIALKECSMYIRERIFEDVRLTDFPSHPSRMKCIWLISEDNYEKRIGFWHPKKLP